MLRLSIFSLFIGSAVWAADDSKLVKLETPEGWSGETIELPPGFAPEMTWKGTEQIRFAPGMMKPSSDSFFSYAFVFDVKSTPALTDDIVKEEFLKYYRGLCKAVLNGQRPAIDFADFKLQLQPVKSDTKELPDHKAVEKPVLYKGTLDWVEPFATKKVQKLNLEIQTWTRNDRNYIFVCVSPLDMDAAIWKQLYTIRDSYLKASAVLEKRKQE